MASVMTQQASGLGGQTKLGTIGKVPLSLVAAICLCGLLTGAVYFPSFRVWLKEWLRPNGYYSHGVLVPAITVGLVWLKRHRLREIPIRPSAWGYLLVVSSLLITVTLTWAGGTSVQGFTFPILIAGMVLVLLGKEFLRELVFPLGYMYFMINLPDFILTIMSFRLQMLSTIGATSILRALQFDVYRNGAVISLPHVDVTVAVACSGFKLLISLFALTFLFAYVMQARNWVKGLLIALMVPVSVILNSLRIAMVSTVGEFMGEESMQYFHDKIAGVIMIALALVTLYFLARLFRCDKLNSTLTS